MSNLFYCRIGIEGKLKVVRSHVPCNLFINKRIACIFKKIETMEWNTNRYDLSNKTITDNLK